MQIKTNRKGIILAGGSGTRLKPITSAISKQLIPLYDKPMIFYPLTTLMQAGIREVLIIVNKEDQFCFERLLGDGSQWGISIQYAIQEFPNGIAQALIIGESFLDKSPVALILGDNLFYGENLEKDFLFLDNSKAGATIFAYQVCDPERYGVVEFGENGKAISIVEKPTKPLSDFVVTGLYFYDTTAVSKAKKIVPSSRGEYEITDLNKMYLEEGLLNVKKFEKGVAWLDTGTFDSLSDAGIFIKTIQNRQGLKIGAPEVTAWRNGWINNDQLKAISKEISKSGYGQYIAKLLN